MGKGGAANYGAPAELPSKRHPAPSYERSELATTLAQPSDEITKRSLRECIPAHCFVRSYAHSLGHLAWDLAMVATAFFAVHYASGVLPFYLVPVAWLGYWWYQGLTCTGLWVLGARAFFPPHRRPRLFSLSLILHSFLSPQPTSAATAALPTPASSTTQSASCYTRR